MTKQMLFMCALLAGGIPAALISPFIGLAVYYGFATLYPQHLWADQLNPDVRWSMWIGVPTLIGFLLHGFARSRAGSRWPIEKKLILLLGVTTFLSMIDAVDPGLALRQAYYFLVLFVMFFVGCALLDSRYRLHVLAILLVGTLGWLAFDFNQRYVLMGQTHILMRGFGGLDNNGVATLMVMGMPLCVFLFIQESKWRYRLVALGVMAMMLHLILFSMSRAAMLIMLVTLPLVLLRLRSRRVGALMLTIMIVAGLALAGREVRARFFTVADYKADDSAQIRLTAWRAGLQVMADHPVLGVGPDCFRRVVGDYAYDIRGRTMHNNFIQTAVDKGIPAGLALVLALVFSLWHLERIRRRHPDDPFAFNMATCLQGCLLGYIGVGMFVSIGTVELPYIIMAMSIGLHNVVTEEGLDPAVDPAPRRRLRPRALLERIRPATT